jgi:hypothetical protein
MLLLDSAGRRGRTEDKKRKEAGSSSADRERIA